MHSSHTPLGDGGGLGHFSEHFSRRDVEVNLGFWVGIGTLGGGNFSQVGLESSLYKK